MSYYEETLQQIEKLIQDNKFEEAKKNINTEMSMPYIPADFERSLLELEKIIPSNDEKLSILSIEEISDCLRKEDEENQMLAIKWLTSINARMIIEDIKYFLTSDKVFNENKTFVLLILREQGIDLDLKVTKMKQEYILNPMKMDILAMEESMNYISKKIEEKQSQNPSVLEISNIILLSYTFVKFPAIQKEVKELDILSDAIQYRAMTSLDVETDIKLTLEIDAIIKEMDGMGL